MSNVLSQLGINKQKDIGFTTLLFYFMKEFHINPLDEEYILDGTKMTKKGMLIPIFMKLLEELSEHNKKEQAQMKRMKR